MKKKRWTILIIMILAVMVLSIIVNAAQISLNKKKASLTVGKTIQLNVKGAKAKIKWSSSNKKVATVSTKGKVKGKKPGQAVITAKIGKNILSCKITVKKKTKAKTKGAKPKFSKNLITLNLYTHSSESVRLTSISASKMKKVKIWLDADGDNVGSFSVSGNKISLSAKKPGKCYLYASYGKKTGRCCIVVDGFNESNVFFCNGKEYDEESCSQTKFGDLLCKAYPKTYGLFRERYISRCKTELAKILSMELFYNDLGYRYQVTNIGGIHYFIKNKVGQCQDYARETYNLCCVAGIPVEVVQSSKLNHAWNQVYIGGSWCPINTTSNRITFWALTYYPKTEIPNDAWIYGGQYATGNKSVSRKGYVLRISGKDVDLSKCVNSFIPDKQVLRINPKGDLKEQLKDIIDRNFIRFDLSSHFG